MRESAAYILTAGDVATSSVVLFGTNQGAFAQATGVGRTVQEDKRRLQRLTIWLERSGVLLPGTVITIIAPTGEQGADWIEVLHSDVQGGGYYVSLPREMTVDYGFGVLIPQGMALAADVVRMRSVYGR